MILLSRLTTNTHTKRDLHTHPSKQRKHIKRDLHTHPKRATSNQQIWQHLERPTLTPKKTYTHTKRDLHTHPTKIYKKSCTDTPREIYIETPTETYTDTPREVVLQNRDRHERKASMGTPEETYTATYTHTHTHSNSKRPTQNQHRQLRKAIQVHLEKPCANKPLQNF